MTKKKVLEALGLVRDGQLERAVEVMRGVDLGFGRRRLAHYRQQPDHRESATLLAEAYEAYRRTMGSKPTPSAPAPLRGLLAPALVESAPVGSVDFSRPEPFLSWASADWSEAPTFDLDQVQHVDVWVVAALGALRLAERERRPPICGTISGPARFAHALGLDELGGGRSSGLAEPERTVRLTRIRTAGEIEPAADKLAGLVIRDPQSDMRLAVRYVLIELLRNVIQHSGDPLGAVVAAQAMGPSQRRPHPMIQLAVADAGIGIPRHLHRTHPHLTDYRQALERSLLPHISGTFEEGLTGSFENAGLGLYMISEMARQTHGNLLIATTGAALVVQNDSMNPAHAGHPRFLNPPGVGFPGTLVAFEIPSDSVEDYYALMQTILRKASERAPKRASLRWLSFEPVGAAETPHRVRLESIRENTPEALGLATREIEPAILRRQAVELDFDGLELCTQSWLHALLFEGIRLAWAKRVAIHAVNADPAVREGLRFLERYALGG